ncbi:unnamed protein product [Orchesella dallaii]|uniref:Uncharacterized protein n=1 Tax=Orchesella dallaii TaxID=48710 RepID=A0ABP1R293_9HEXA
MTYLLIILGVMCVGGAPRGLLPEALDVHLNNSTGNASVSNTSAVITLHSKAQSMTKLETERILDPTLTTSSGQQSVRENRGNETSENSTKTITKTVIVESTGVHPTTPKPIAKSVTLATTKPWQPQQTTVQPPHKIGTTASPHKNGTKTGKKPSTTSSPLKTTHKKITYTTTTPSPPKPPKSFWPHHPHRNVHPGIYPDPSKYNHKHK